MEPLSRFRAVLFDLDGTLIGIDMDAFIPVYLARLTEWVADRVDPERFRRAVLGGSLAVLQHADRSRTNEQVFWQVFEGLSGIPRAALEPRLEEFYRRVFPELRALAEPVPGAVEAVEAAFRSGARVVIATQPIFPEVAIRERLRWAGLDGFPFDLITSFEHMHACKPHPAYFEEVLERLGVAPAEALMVGNDPEVDLAAARVGLRTFLVEGGGRYGSGLSLVGQEPVGGGHRPDFRGDLADLVRLLSLSHPTG